MLREKKICFHCIISTTIIIIIIIRRQTIIDNF